MRDFPAPVLEYARCLIADRHSPAYLWVHKDGRLLAAGGALAVFGLHDLRPDDQVVERVDFMVGLLPLEGAPLTLSSVEVCPGCFADIHLFAEGENNWVLLFDETAEVMQRTRTEEALRRSLEQLRQSQKMEAIGRMAGGVVHDFNNLLAVIISYGKSLIDNLPQSEKHHKDAEEIVKAAHRAAALTQQLIAVGRRQVLRPKVVDLNSTVQGLEKMIRQLIGEHIALEVTLASDLWQVEADVEQIERVIINLVLNARDAMPAGGRLQIQSENVQWSGEGPLGHAGELAPGAYAVLVVGDTGHGMDQDTLAHIFEPFFTTKAPDKGTGLGLSTAYGVIKQSRGQILVDSRPGLGTVFRIYLPAVGAGERGDHAAHNNTAPAGNPTRTVLIVDDEPTILFLMKRALSSRYQVLQACQGQEALHIALTHQGPIHLMITDVGMPEISGVELAEQVQRERPEIKILYVSGYTDAVGLSLPKNAPLLPKPFTMEALLQRVSAL